jgi:hypothetical protein
LPHPLRHFAFYPLSQYKNGYYILDLAMLNDESGLCEMSVMTWTVSYDIGYVLSSKSRTLECWKAISSATRTKRIFFSFYYYSYLLTKFGTHPTFLNNGGTCESNWLDMSLPTREEGMKEGILIVHTRITLVPLKILRALKGNEHQKLTT